MPRVLCVCLFGLVLSIGGCGKGAPPAKDPAVVKETESVTPSDAKKKTGAATGSVEIAPATNPNIKK